MNTGQEARQARVRRRRGQATRGVAGLAAGGAAGDAARTPVWGWAITALAVPVAAWVFWQAQLWLRTDLASAGARKAAVDWASGARKPPTEPEWAQAVQALHDARALQPRHPGLAEPLGDLHMVAARRDWADEARRNAALAQAVQHYQEALAQRPADPQTWAALAAAEQGRGNAAAMRAAWAKALALGPNEGHVQPMLLELALASWADATPQMQQWAIALYDASSAAQRKAINRMAERYGLTFAQEPVRAP